MYSSKEELLEGIKKEGVEYVDIRFCDLPGVMQHFSIPADKFEEDILDRPTATVRAARQATVMLGEPILVPAEKKRDAAHELTVQLELRVQELLDSVEPPERDFGTVFFNQSTVAPEARSHEE